MDVPISGEDDTEIQFGNLLGQIGNIKVGRRLVVDALVLVAVCQPHGNVRTFD